MTPRHAPLDNDQRAIDELVRAFFDLFTNRGEVALNLDAIFELCIPEAIISKCVGSSPVVSSLEAFIAPRQALLSDGTLTDFQETEVAQYTQVLGNVAQRSCIYRKSGVLNGARFETRGVKVFQFIRCAHGWRISAVSWDDERDGFSPDSIDLTGFRRP